MSVQSNIDPQALRASDEREEQARARKAAAARRQKRSHQTIMIRSASLAIVLIAWEIFGAHVDPILFAPPSKVVIQFVTMVRSGELWTYLWPSLVVFGVGLSIAAVLGIGIGLLFARYWFLDVALGTYITFLYSTPTVALPLAPRLTMAYALQRPQSAGATAAPERGCHARAGASTALTTA